MDMAPPSQRSRRDPQASALPPDLLYDILLLLPGEDLCRFRAVCRPWRILLSDPLFIAAHAARHPDPFIVAGYEASPGHQNGLVLCDVMDLSGRVVKRVRAGAERDRVMRAHLDLLCVARGGSSMSCQLLNPATGAAHVLPEGLAAEHAGHRQGFVDCWASAAFGLVASTGEYKVLRVVQSFRHVSYPPMKLYEVCTIDGSGSSQARWRGKNAPQYNFGLEDWNSVVIKHIVYFLLSGYGTYNSRYEYDHRHDLVASFDLETEKWSASIRAPFLADDDDDDDADVYGIFINRPSWFDFKITSIGERWVLVRRTPFMVSPSMDIWFLRYYYKKGLWVKQYRVEISALHVPHLVQPLLALKDGRMIANNHIRNWAFLKNFDSATNGSADVLKMKHGAVTVGLYGGSLLSLASGNSKS